jgi:hypothetical protein
MKIKKTLLLPLLALVLPCVFVLPTFAHAAFQPRLSLDSGSGAVCKPVVQISRYHLNFWSDALRLDVSPCTIAALQQDGAITLQTDNSIGSITEQALKTLTPDFKKGLIAHMNVDSHDNITVFSQSNFLGGVLHRPVRRFEPLSAPETILTINFPGRLEAFAPRCHLTMREQMHWFFS